MGDFRVQLYKNEPNSAPVEFTVKRSWDMTTFKRQAGKKLSMNVKRVYLASGSEVTGCDEMSANEELYLSSGEPFFRAKAQAQETYYVSVLGTGGVGKSALTLRFVRDFFVQDWDPTIEDAYRKTLDVDNGTCALDILDTAGQDDFESLRPSWMIEKDGYIFVFSLDQPQSLGELQPFIDLHYQINENRNVPIVLAANKKDMTENTAKENLEELRKTRQKGLEIATKLGAKYIETSARTGENVQEAFEEIVKQVRKLKKKAPAETKPKRCMLM